MVETSSYCLSKSTVDNSNNSTQSGLLFLRSPKILRFDNLSARIVSIMFVSLYDRVNRK